MRAEQRLREQVGVRGEQNKSCDNMMTMTDDRIAVIGIGILVTSRELI